jgi:YHS domain-containing protein
MNKVLSLALAVVFGAAALVTLAADKPTKPKPYPLDTCVVTGEKLGGMGDPFVFTHEGQEIKLCCKSCKKDFDKDPAKFMGKVTEANKKVKPYKLETCLVSGEKLGDDAVALVYQGQEVKLCCKNCVKKFEKDPAKFMAKVTGAKK